MTETKNIAILARLTKDDGLHSCHTRLVKNTEAPIIYYYGNIYITNKNQKNIVSTIYLI